MIDVMKRLAELDAKNPQVVKENQSVAECGPMGMMDSMPGMGMDKPSIPANFSINATAASGNEVADMMSQILTLAGMKAVGADDLGAEPQGALVTAEPGVSVGPMAAEPMPSAADDMRSVLDKLNPEPTDGEEGGEEVGPFQGNDDEEGGEEQSPFAGNDQGDDEDDEEETDESQYDNSPAEEQPKKPFDANEFAHQENQPGAGDTSSGQERQRNLPTATFENLMKEYKSFIGEAEEEDEDMEEAAEKTPTTWTDSKGNEHPATRVKGDKYTGKEAEKDSKDKKEVDESMADILKLSGLK